MTSPLQPLPDESADMRRERLKKLARRSARSYLEDEEEAPLPPSVISTGAWAEGSTPDEQAAELKLADEARVPPSTVKGAVPEVQWQFDVENFNKHMQDTPATRSWVAKKPERARLIRDDIEGLSTVSKFIKAHQVSGWGIVELADIGFAQLEGRASAESLKRAEQLEELTQIDYDAHGIANLFVESGRMIPMTEEVLMHGAETGMAYAMSTAMLGGIAGSAAGGIGAGPGTIGGFAVGGRLGFMWGASKRTYQLEAGLAYREYLAMHDEDGTPIDPYAAKVAAYLAGVTNAALEMTSLGLLARALRGVPGMANIFQLMGRKALKKALQVPTYRRALIEFGKAYGIGFGGEVTTEVFQRAVTLRMGQAAAAASEGYEFDGIDWGEELGSEAYGAAQGLALLPLLPSGLSLGFNANRARNANQSLARHKAMVKRLQKTKLYQRHREEFHSWAEEVAKDGGDPNVFVDAAGAIIYFQEQKMNPVEALGNLGVSLDDTQDAVLAKGDLVVPLTRVLEMAETREGILDHVRDSGGSMTPLEAQMYGEQMDENVNRELGEYARKQDEIDQVQQQAQVVYDEVYKRLLVIPQAPGAAAVQARIFQAHYETMARRTGLTPAELWNKMPVTFKYTDRDMGWSATFEGETLRQPGIQDSMSSEDIAVGDWAGRLVFHGTSAAGAASIVGTGVDMMASAKGYFGRGFYVTSDASYAQSHYAEFAEEEDEEGPGEVISIKISDDARILDLRSPADSEVWDAALRGARGGLGAEDFHEQMVAQGIDGLFDRSFDGVVIYNPAAIEKTGKVYGQAALEPGHIPTSLAELQAQFIMAGRLNTDHADALGSLVRGVASYLGMNPDEYVRQRFRGVVERGDGPAKDALFAIRTLSAGVDVVAPKITKAMGAGKKITKATMRQYARAAVGAGLTDEQVLDALDHFEQYNKVVGFGHYIVVQGSDEKAVVLREGVLNTAPIEGERRRRLDILYEAIENGTRSAATGALFEGGRERTGTPKELRGLTPKVFLNIPITQPRLQRPRPADLDVPVFVTGNPHIGNFARPHSSWDAVITVVRVKPVHGGNETVTNAVVAAIKYAEEIGAKTLITSFRAKQAWALAKFTNIVTTDPTHAEFSKYWQKNPHPRSTDPLKLPDWVPYIPKSKGKHVFPKFRAAGWDIEKNIYGKGGTWWWPRTRAVDKEVLDQVGDVALEYCDLLHKGCPGCQNCQKLSFPGAKKAPLIGVTDEPFCEHACPQCFVRIGQSGVRGRQGISVGKNAKQSGYGEPQWGDLYPESIIILQGVARKAGGNRGVVDYVANFMLGDAGDRMDSAMSLFMDDLITPDELEMMRTEIVNEAQTVKDKNGPVPEGRLFKLIGDEERASVEFDEDDRALIRALEAPTVADMAHELGHVFRRDLSVEDNAIVEAWLGIENGVWTRKHEETWALGFEKYLAEGKAPQPEMQSVFEKFHGWMQKIYNGILGSEIDVELSDPVRNVMGRLVGGGGPSQVLFQGGPIWTSKLNDVVADKLQARGTGASYKKTIEAWANKGLFKAQEVAYSGLLEWLEDQAVEDLTKDDVQEYLETGGVRVTHVKSEDSAEDFDTYLEEYIGDRMADFTIVQQPDTSWFVYDGTAADSNRWFVYDDFDSEEQAYEALSESIGEEAHESYADNSYERNDLAPEYEGWTLKGAGRGGYHEVVLQIPEAKPWIDTSEWVATLSRKTRDQYGDIWQVETGTGEPVYLVSQSAQGAINSVAILKTADRPKLNFQGGHYGNKGFPNVFAHYRADIRTAPDGKKVYLINEIQSDWHQRAGERRTSVINAIIEKEEISREEASKRVPKNYGYEPPVGQMPYGTTMESVAAVTVDPTGWTAALISPEEQVNYGVNTNVPYKVYDASGNQVGNAAVYADSAAEAIGKMESSFNKPAHWVMKDPAGLEIFRAYVPTQEEALDLWGTQPHQRVPDAPFKTTWPMVAFKHALRSAVEEGADRIGWVTGEQAASFYDLRKTVKEIMWSQPEGTTSGAIEVFVNLTNGNVIHFGTNKAGLVVSSDRSEFMGRELSEVLGKKLAAKIMKEKKKGKASGDDLAIGVEGMQRFYDGIVTTEVGKYSKKMKAGKPGMIEVPGSQPRIGDLEQRYVGPELSVEAVEAVREARRADHAHPDEIDSWSRVIRSMELDETLAWAMVGNADGHMAFFTGGRFESIPADVSPQLVHGFDITDEMREKVLSGQELFQPGEGEKAPPRGQIEISPGETEATIHIFETGDLSSVLHETGHVFLKLFEKLAGGPNAPQQIRDDWRTLREWVGAKPAQPMTEKEIERITDYWEKEYLTRGKAPSEELRSAFARFRGWLFNVYRLVKELGREVNPEVDAVFDRWLATDDQIARVEASADFQPAYRDRESSPLTNAEWLEYQKLQEKEGIEARDAGQRREMEEAQREERRWLKAQENQIRDRVTSAVDASPVMRAQRWLRTGEWQGEQPPGLPYMIPPGVQPNVPIQRISKQWVLAHYGVEEGKKKLAQMGRGAGIMYQVEGGWDADDIAPTLGFGSGEQLIDALIDAPSRKEQIEGEVEAQMEGVTQGREDPVEGALESFSQSRARGDRLAVELAALRRSEAAELMSRAAERQVTEEGAAPAAELDQEVSEADETAALLLLARPGDEAARAQALSVLVAARARREAGVKGRQAQRAGVRQTRLATKMHLPDIRRRARQQIAQTPLENLRPGKFTHAELRASRETQEAIARRDYEAAAAAKQAQLLNHCLYREAVKARDRADKIVRHLAKYELKAERQKLGLAGGSYLEQLDGLLERVGLKRSVTKKELRERKSFTAWKEEQEVAGLKVLVPERLLDAGTPNWREMTLQELDGLKDTADHIVELARLKNHLVANRETVELNGSAGEMAQSAYENNALVKDSVRNPKGLQKLQSLREFGRSADALLLKMEQLVDWMDGGDPQGPWHRLLFIPVAEAQHFRNDLILRTSEAFEAARLGLEPDSQAWMEKLHWVPSLNENLYGHQLVAIALNTGNESNLAKMMKGGSKAKQGAWSEEDVLGALQFLKEDHWFFVQQVWDLLAEYKPLMSKVQKQMTGLEPTWVKERAFTTPFGQQLRGGYYPAVYDHKESRLIYGFNQNSEAALFEWDFTKPDTRHGHMEERIEGFARPMLLDLNIVTRHIGQVAHDIAFRPVLSDAYKLLNHPDVQAAVSQTMGEEYARTLVPWLHGIANQMAGDLTLQALENLFRRGRHNATIMIMGWKATTAFTQIAGIAPSVELLDDHLDGRGKYWLGIGVAEWKAGPKKAYTDVTKKSGEMRHRFARMDRDLVDGMRKMQGLIGPEYQMKKTAFYFIGVFDMVVSITTWNGAYQQAIHNDLDEAAAIQYADSMVRMSQGGGEAKDLSQIQRGGEKQMEIVKSLTMFMGYFSAYYQRQRASGRSLRRTKDFPRFMMKHWWMTILPVIMAELLTGNEPPEKKKGGYPLTRADQAAWWAKRVIGYTAAGIPLGREAVSTVTLGYQYRVTPVSEPVLAAIRLTDEVWGGVEGELDYAGLMKQLVRVVGYARGLPLEQPINITGAQMLDVVLGEEPFAARDLFFRRPWEGRQ